jgi:hypothetical protein
MNILGRRVDALEAVLERHRMQGIADEYGIPVDELVSGSKRMDAEASRLRSTGLSESQVWRGVLTWLADDQGVDLDELANEWERSMKERGKWPPA